MSNDLFTNDSIYDELEHVVNIKHELITSKEGKIKKNQIKHKLVIRRHSFRFINTHLRYLSSAKYGLYSKHLLRVSDYINIFNHHTSYQKKFFFKVSSFDKQHILCLFIQRNFENRTKIEHGNN